MRRALTALLLYFLAPTAWAFGTEKVEAPDPEDRPLSVLVFYPTHPGQTHQISGAKLPLILISHGTGGSNDGHTDTAQALASSGFVVAAVMHTGDNYRDENYVKHGRHLEGRARHISRTIDYMLTAWRGHAQIDESRIGVFGHSAGGFTALVAAGANPDMSRGKAHCAERPDAWDCQYLRKHHAPPITRVDPLHDSRIRAIAIATPAVGYSFTRESLAKVTIPVQLWHAEHDNVVEDSALLIRNHLPTTPEFHFVKNAGHFSFIRPCDLKMRAIIGVMRWFGTEKICDDPEGFDRTAFHTAFNAEIVRFFQENLKLQTARES